MLEFSVYDGVCPLVAKKWKRPAAGKVLFRLVALFILGFYFCLRL